MDRSSRRRRSRAGRRAVRAVELRLRSVLLCVRRPDRGRWDRQRDLRLPVMRAHPGPRLLPLRRLRRVAAARHAAQARGDVRRRRARRGDRRDRAPPQPVRLAQARPGGRARMPRTPPAIGAAAAAAEIPTGAVAALRGTTALNGRLADEATALRKALDAKKFKTGDVQKVLRRMAIDARAGVGMLTSLAAWPEAAGSAGCAPDVLRGPPAPDRRRAQRVDPQHRRVQEGRQGGPLDPRHGACDRHGRAHARRAGGRASSCRVTFPKAIR